MIIIDFLTALDFLTRFKQSSLQIFFWHMLPRNNFGGFYTRKLNNFIDNFEIPCIISSKLLICLEIKEDSSLVVIMKSGNFHLKETDIASDFLLTLEKTMSQHLVTHTE